MFRASSRRRLRAVLCPLALALVILLPLRADAAEPGSITGRVVERGGKPVPDASVSLDLRQRVATDTDGVFTFESVAPGRHVLRVERIGFEPNVRSIELDAGQSLEVEIPLEAFHYEETVVITASTSPRSSHELYQPVSVLSGADLLASAQPSLGETLEALPGVSSTYFGPGASRPIIRGLGGDRVRVMSNGLELGDAASTSPDHAVGADAMQAERIEVVRGPATLRWGSNAIGGVVNVLDNRLPTSVPETPVTGIGQVLAGTQGSERSASLVLDGGHGEFAWHLDGFARDASDASTPEGRLVNSWTEASGAAAGLGWIGERGRFSVAYAGLESEYGSPAEEDISIDLEQRRWDAEGEVRWTGPMRGLTFRIGGTDYEHVELEGSEVGTRFLNDSFEGRIESTHAVRGRHEGSFGIQYTDRDFAAIGDEAFVPRTITSTLGFFAFQEFHVSGNWRLQAAGRWDTRDVDVRDGSGKSRDLDGFSSSFGVLRSGPKGLAFSASLSRVVKLPNAEELFSNGPHLATGSFEIGDPLLDEEVGLGLELGVRKQAEWWSIELSLFAQRFDGFIREAPTGEVEDGLPVFRFLQEDAELRGGELVASIGLNRHERHHLRLDAMLEHVWSLGEGGEPLPRMPPFTGSLALRYDGPRAWAFVRGTWVDSQNRIADFETRTDGHALLDAQAGFRILGKRSAHDIILQATNLTDELARVHASFLKDVAPLPGRGAALLYRIVF